MTLLLLLTLNSFGSPHVAAMKKVSLPHVSETRLHIEGEIFINVKYHGLNNFEATSAFNVIQKSSKLARSYLQKDDFSINDCKSLSIDIYDISDSDLNDRQLMSFVDWSKRSQSGVYAIYDSLFAPVGRASIFITASRRVDKFGLDSVKRKVILSHEMMHYWQDRTCNLSHKLEDQSDKFSVYVKSQL